MARFTDKVVVVVGAAQGIGRVTADLFAKEGATVVATDVNPAIDKVFVGVPTARPLVT